LYYSIKLNYFVYSATVISCDCVSVAFALSVAINTTVWDPVVVGVPVSVAVPLPLSKNKVYKSCYI